MGLRIFCEVGMILRLRQNLYLSYNVFAKLKLDLEYFCPKRREKRNWTEKNFVKKVQKGERELDLR